MKRNPPWARDEIILALDLYFKVNPTKTSQDNSDIVKLSELLNKLPIHTNRPDADKFRNRNGVYMKLCNFLSLDPNYKGTGLAAHSKLDKAIWDEFAKDRDRLAKVARAIKENQSIKPISNIDTFINITEEDDFPEGKILNRTHQVRERNATLVRKKKQKVLKEKGCLECEVCDFDFLKFYGPIGEGFIECHHTVPVSDLDGKSKTRLIDLAIVCSNCHRMLHRTRPWLSIHELKLRVKETEPNP